MLDWKEQPPRKQERKGGEKKSERDAEGGRADINKGHISKLATLPNKWN